MIKYILVAFFVAGAAIECQERYHHPQYKTELRLMCEKFGAQDKVDEVENSLQSFVDCFYGLFGTEQNQKEYKGSLNVKKHCDKSKQLNTCLSALSHDLGPCMDHSYDETVSDSGVEMVLNYICYKDGEQFSSFFADIGPECFQEKILECARNQTKFGPTSRAAILLSVNDPCGNFNELSTCVVTAMAECSNNKRPGTWPSPCCDFSVPSCFAIQQLK